MIPPLPPASLREVRVLVVHDNLTNRRILEKVLAGWQMRPSLLSAQSAGSSQPPSLVTRHSLREHRAGLHILLAEDNPVNRTLAVRLLEKQAHTVEVAEDGHAALAKLKIGKFDLVLMDVQMPGMDGFQATTLIRAMEKKRGGHVPILAMTAYALKGDRERCLAAGMDGYIGKPFRVEEVLQEIDSLSQHAAVK